MKKQQELTRAVSMDGGDERTALIQFNEMLGLLRRTGWQIENIHMATDKLLGRTFFRRHRDANA